MFKSRTNGYKNFPYKPQRLMYDDYPINENFELDMTVFIRKRRSRHKIYLTLDI